MEPRGKSDAAKAMEGHPHFDLAAAIVAVATGFAASRASAGLSGGEQLVAVLAAAVAGYLIVPVAWAVIAAIRAPVAQRNEARRLISPPICRVVPHLEAVPWKLMIDGTIWQHAWCLWIEVYNDGPTSQFAARAPAVTGVPAWWGTDYKILRAGWEDDPQHGIEVIERGGMRRLKFASVLEHPRGFWFWTSQDGHGVMPGNQWPLGPDGTTEIGFQLEIVDTGDQDRTLRAQGSIRIPKEVSQAEASLETDDSGTDAA